MSRDFTIFVVDDDEAVRDSLRALLGSAGLTVEAYASGREFLEGYAPHRRGCLLLDVRLPDMSGLELQRTLAAQEVGLAVIMITGHGDVPMAVNAMKAGAVDFIEKPYRDDTILGCIERARDLDQSARSRDGSTTDAAARIALLTAREREVLDHLIIGRPNKVIAHELGISARTVEVHRARVMEKMQADSLSHLVRMALAAGIDPQPG